MDSMFYAQYPEHTGETLGLLEDALSHFYENKSIFIDLEIWDNFNIPKLHFTSQCVDLIKLYGTTDNFITEYTEYLHLDFAKETYATTNHKDKFVQMETWLECKEKIHQHAYLVCHQLEGSPPIVMVPCKWLPPGLELDSKLHTSRTPSVQKVALEALETEYGAQHFHSMTVGQVKHRLWHVHFHFQHLPVWHKTKFLHTDVHNG